MESSDCWKTRLTNTCYGIEKLILFQMHRAKVVWAENEKEDILTLSNINQEDLKRPCLYRWLVPADMDIIKVLQKKCNKRHPELKTILANMDEVDIDGVKYHPIYFGKSVNGYKRIITQHLRGTVKTSTIRHTLSGLMFRKYISNKQKINEYLINTYFEFVTFDSECPEIIVPLEAICIALGNYPLNIDGNLALNSKETGWGGYLMRARKASKKPKPQKQVVI